MTASHVSRISPAWSKRCTGLALTLLAASPTFGAELPGAQGPITAVYKAQELSFQYRGQSRLYSCPELEQRVARILVGVGARDDIKVDARNCEFNMMPEEDVSFDPTFRRDRYGESERWGTTSRLREPRSGREQSTSIRVQLMFPVEVTPKVLDELEKDKSRRELVSRVTGNPAAAFNEPITFVAQRQEVELSHRTARLQAEDCELLEQMSTQVFRRLDVRVVRRNLNCDASRIPPQITVESLLPTGQLVPLPEKEKQKSGSAPEVPATTPAQPPAEPAPQ